MTDPPDEQRFSLAHELAHLLRDYDGVRQRLRHRIGESAADDRLHAVLRNVSVGPLDRR